jgi:hypothetical protein
MIQVTQAPTIVQVGQRFSVVGVASPTYAGQRLKLTVDNQFETQGPIVGDNGAWEVAFLFQQAGSRRLKISISNESVEVPIQVTVNPVPPPSRLRFLNVPQNVSEGQRFTIEGEADNYADGATLLLRADSRFELSRPKVEGQRWQAFIGFSSAGRRLLEIIGDGQDRAEIVVEVRPIPLPPPRPPRLTFVNPPKSVKADQAFILQGGAKDYIDGAQLVLRADRQLELSRPLVKSGTWQSAVVFRQTGERLVEIIGSEQDRAQTTITITPVQENELEVIPRSAWTSIPTPSELPNLLPQRITLHHTVISALPVSATQAQEVARMRQIYNIHVNSTGWADIGYHFIVMPSGRIYEARMERKRGSHDLVNDGLGIAFDGIHTTAVITQQQFNATVALCTKLCQRYGIKDPVTPVPTPTGDFGTRNLPRILGHRDRVSTECPGSEGGRTVRLAEIRQAVKQRL